MKNEERQKKNVSILPDNQPENAVQIDDKNFLKDPISSFGTAKFKLEAQLHKFNNSLDRLEVRRICKWLNFKFNKEVIENIVEERVFKNLKGLGYPSSDHLKAGRINLKNHENYFEWVLKERTFLAGEFFSIADIAYSACLSTLDYLGEIDWERISLTKKWYAKIKSRPSFRDILEEKLFTIPPAKHYQDLDF